jgi:hypothetical protein
LPLSQNIDQIDRIKYIFTSKASGSETLNNPNVSKAIKSTAKKHNINGSDSNNIALMSSNGSIVSLYRNFTTNTKSYVIPNFISLKYFTPHFPTDLSTKIVTSIPSISTLTIHYLIYRSPIYHHFSHSLISLFFLYKIVSFNLFIFYKPLLVRISTRGINYFIFFIFVQINYYLITTIKINLLNIMSLK